MMSSLSPLLSSLLIHVQIYMIDNQVYLQVKNKWKSIYPVYIDSTKSIQQGRRIALELCVKQPTLEELVRAVCLAQLRNIVEPHKCYSRDYFEMGRLKVELLNQKGKPVHASIPNKKKMLETVAKHLTELRKK